MDIPNKGPIVVRERPWSTGHDNIVARPPMVDIWEALIQVNFSKLLFVFKPGKFRKFLNIINQGVFKLLYGSFELKIIPLLSLEGVWKIKQPKSANLTVVGRGLENFSEHPSVIT